MNGKFGGIEISENILRKTVGEAMNYIVSFYKNHSGDIKAYDNDDNKNTLTLAFREGNAYLVTVNPLMNKIVHKFTISESGYHKHIELYA